MTATFKAALLLLILVLPFQGLHGSTQMTLADARHLLSRTGFGASPAEINELLNLNRTEAVEKIISGLNTEPQSPLPAWTKNSAPYHWSRQELPKDEKQKFAVTRRNEIQSLRQWWVQEMISTTSPQTERLLLFWHDHFATAHSAINDQSISIARQHNMLRQYGSGNFRTLLKQIIRDPAMLNYLDNNGSRKVKPNENLAREILELFTLGEGNYTESDIKNAARALTGYSYSEVYDLRFVFAYWDHDTTEKTLFGQNGNFNGDDLIDLILLQPAAANFIAGKFWTTFVASTPADIITLQRHATAFQQSDYDIKTLYKSILMSQEFWSAENRASLVQPPVPLTIGTIRSTGIIPADWQTLPNQLSQMGQKLFDPPNVAGWPENEAWITPGRLLTRLEWLERLAQPSTSTSSDAMTMDAKANNTMTMSNMSGDSMAMNSMQMSGSENTMTMQGSESTMTSANDSAHNLTIRMAAEEFDEPAKYLVEAYANNNKIWSSGERSLPGGHDTKRMGRINRTNMPWQLISFPINNEEIDTIEISFLNDAAIRNGADRNLFISSATHGNRTWIAAEGTQIGKCAKKRPKQQHNLFCNGTLRLEKYTESTNTPAKTIAKNTFSAGGVYLGFAQKTKRRPRSELVFNLSDVEFNGRQWNTMSVKYIKEKHGYAIWINNYDCWPNCIEEWPECSWLSDQDPTSKTVALSIGDIRSKKSAEHHENLACMYNELNTQDKQLAHALWSLVGEFYKEGQSSYKLRRENLAANYQLWKAEVEKMQQQVMSSKYFNDDITLQMNRQALVDSTMTETIAPPTPAGLSNDAWQASFQKLQQTLPGTTLLSLLLPTAPVTAKEGTENLLKEVITDLSYQLK